MSLFAVVGFMFRLSVVALTFVLLALFAPASGSEFRVDLTTPAASYHFDRATRRNEYNPGVGVQWSLNGSLSVAMGSFRNSHGRVSRFGTVHWGAIRRHEVVAGLVAGMIDGYPANSGDPLPVAALFVRWDRPNPGLSVLLLPPYAEVTAGAVAVQLLWRVW